MEIEQRCEGQIEEKNEKEKKWELTLYSLVSIMENGEKFAVSPLTLCGNYRLSFLLIKENCSFGIYAHISIKCICKTACESGIRCSRHLRAAICIYRNIHTLHSRCIPYAWHLDVWLCMDGRTSTCRFEQNRFLRRAFPHFPPCG